MEIVFALLFFTVMLAMSDIGEELRKFREGITDEKVLIGYNMAIAICNKYLGESEE